MCFLKRTQSSLVCMRLVGGGLIEHVLLREHILVVLHLAT
jgi:hypothetical protein